MPSELAPVSLAAIAGMAAIALGVVLSPGPNMIYLVSRSITQGRRAGLISLAGVAAGFAVYLVAATLGLTAVFTAVPQLYLAVKLAGAGYLAFLAWKTLRPGG
ncbi:MAG TPA: LysE family transporter, partial [Microlunatus sp.]|nr:LysE family transporter [Microlunatus sp.]